MTRKHLGLTRTTLIGFFILALVAGAPGDATAIEMANGTQVPCGDGTTVLVAGIIAQLLIVVLLLKFVAPLALSIPGLALGAALIFAFCQLSDGPPESRSALLQSVAAAQLPVDSAVEDFNGDGNPDVAIANQGSSNVSVSLGKDDGTFEAPVEYPTGSSPVRIIAGRFDADAHVDLVTANAGNGLAGNLSLLLGDGDGSFQAPIAVAAGTLPLDVAAGDFDEDDELDLAAADTTGGVVVVRLGNGNGTFQAETPLATVGGVRSLAVARMDDDEHDDIVTNRNILLGQGNGTFDPAANFAVGLAPSLARVGDVNDDTKPDVVTTNQDGHFVRVFVGNGDGTLRSPRHYVAGNKPDEVVILDVDGDSLVDLLVSNANDDHVSLLHGFGDGTFLDATTYPSVADLASRSGAFAAAVADFTGDQVPDVVAANGGTASFHAGVSGNLGDRVLGTAAVLPGQSGTRVIAGD